ADVDIPFVLVNADSTETVQANQPVSGYLTIHPIKMDEFDEMFEQMGFNDLKGTFQMHGILDGTAGRPTMRAGLNLTYERLSDLPIDSLTASLNYQNKASKLDFKAALISDHQKMLNLRARMPITLNLQIPDISPPGPEDSISVDIEANEFNLKALNGFMNHEMVRDLKGIINENATISRRRKDLQAEGKLTLKKGALRVVKLGITLDNIASTLEFHPDNIELTNLHMESGKGSLNGEGKVNLKNTGSPQLD